MFEIIFLIVVCLYFIQSFIFITGAAKKYAKTDENSLPSVSVIVAARNEEKNILTCLQSLDGLIYPDGKLEIIIVNDNSTDCTAEIVSEYIKEKSRFRLINTERTIGHLKGKTNALANALEKASGELIFTTDADCTVPPLWVKSLALYYTDDVAMVCGYTTQKVKGQFSGMQMLDFIYLLTVAAGTMNLGRPLSCIGNNMSYRKKVYDEVGGYEGLAFSVTEDFNLMKAFSALRKYKIIYPMEPDALVTSEPCADLKSLYWQKKRWGVGGLASGLDGYAVMASGFLASIGMLLSPFMYSDNILFIIIFKIASDIFLLMPVLSRLKISGWFRYFLSFQIYFVVYVIVLPLLVLTSRRVIWKGRSF